MEHGVSSLGTFFRFDLEHRRHDNRKVCCFYCAVSVDGESRPFLLTGIA